jgi:outer membrane receptor protein involved in Fe transport
MFTCRWRVAALTVAASAPLAIASGFAFSQQADDDAPTQTVVVSAKRLNAARATIQTQTGASTYTIDSAAIQTMPGGDNTSLSQIVLRAPDVAQDSFGQIHVRGEHNGLQYRLNGIILPEGINVFGQTLDPRLVNSMQLIMGALPAEYGLRTAGIIDLTTKSGILEPHGNVSLYGGSHGLIEPSLFHGGSADGFSYFVTADFQRSDLGIESPDGSADPLHDHTKQYHAFGYLEYILDPDDRLSAVLGLSHGEFEIPNRRGMQPAGIAGVTGLGPCGDGTAFYGPPCTGTDMQVLLANGQYAFPSEHLDENQTEITEYAIASYQHAQDEFDLQSSLTARYTSLTFFPDVLGDVLYNGIAQNAFKRDVAYGWQTDAAFHLITGHTLRAGFYLQHDRAASDTTSQVLGVDASGLQVSDAPIAIGDNSEQTQSIESAYLQDEWQILQPLTVNYGLRFDHLSAYTSGQQVSPRVNIVWKPLTGMTVHGGYSRYFSPPPFELVGLGTITRFANTTAAPANTVADPPLPEKANYYDVGVQQQFSPGLTVGLDTYYKQSTDLVDEGQFGAPIILTPFNYRYGQQYGAEFTLNYAMDAFSLYANAALQRARGKDIVSAQFNFSPDELAYIADHYISLDHEQQYTASAGASYLWSDTRFSADILFGSGLRASLMQPDGSEIPNGTHLPYYRQVNLGISHSFHSWGTGASKDRPTLRFDIVNLFDTVYQIRNGSGVGVGAPQYGPRRGVFLGLSVPF